MNTLICAPITQNSLPSCMHYVRGYVKAELDVGVTLLRSTV